MNSVSKEELIRWGESQQDGNCLAPAKYRFVEYNLEEVRKDYERARKNVASGSKLLLSYNW